MTQPPNPAGSPRGEPTPEQIEADRRVQEAWARAAKAADRAAKVSTWQSRLLTFQMWMHLVPFIVGAMVCYVCGIYLLRD